MATVKEELIREYLFCIDMMTVIDSERLFLNNPMYKNSTYYEYILDLCKCWHEQTRKCRESFMTLFGIGIDEVLFYRSDRDSY